MSDNKRLEEIKRRKAAYMREWYLRNRDTVIAREKLRNLTPKRKQQRKEYNDKDRAEKRAYVDKIKLKRGCIDCGYKKNPRALEFDHVRGKKVAAISVMVTNRVSILKIQEEIDKCEVRCANCHKIKTWDKP